MDPRLSRGSVTYRHSEEVDRAHASTPNEFTMRVLHVIPAVAPRYGGPSQAIFEMCRALQEREIEPLIASTDADGTGRLPVELGHSLV
jgi:hypothetical protein